MGNVEAPSRPIFPGDGRRCLKRLRFAKPCGELCSFPGRAATSHDAQRSPDGSSGVFLASFTDLWTLDPISMAREP